MPRRHRIFQPEITPTMRAVHQRLTAINTTDEITNEKTQLFKLLWRMHQHRTGPPHYPDITKNEITKLLETTRKTIDPI